MELNNPLEDQPVKASTSGQLLATTQHRFGGAMLEIALIISSFITVGLAWIIWNFVVWGQGQTPSKQILKMRVYSVDTGKPASWGHMAIRQFLIPSTFSMVYLPFFIAGLSLAIENVSDYSVGGTLVIGYIVYLVVILLDALWVFKDGSIRRLTDVWARTIVVNESR
jgi:uncharacterized RDD family membrane protein YckC